ncbi:hypothetical protein JRO89_XS12G0072700 [Xanthoceras sorbifolium]|uniref:Gamma-interferon-inducible lysosomal thiol reductase n=1 Tax=Xanthoceras sorbifolium TaxID=99658 RepID=A0ABQ8HBN8_9ROSI|nr:hypothetical protein JRO89_XS12G0072700 [Xanthoceras sorbifolium]
MARAHLHSLFVLTTLMFIFISPSDSILEGGDDVYVAKVSSPVKPKKVDLALYYEPQCPFCANFIVNVLVKVFQTDLKTIVSLRLVPWGNAQVINGTTICQHGENECYLNTIHACAIKAWPEVIKHFSFIRCIEAEIPGMQVKHSQDVETAWRKCADYQGLAQEPIDNCYNSGEGTKLSLGYGNETDYLKPPHEFVPWVTVNNVALREVNPGSHL